MLSPKDPVQTPCGCPEKVDRSLITEEDSDFYGIPATEDHSRVFFGHERPMPLVQISHWIAVWGPQTRWVDWVVGIRDCCFVHLHPFPYSLRSNFGANRVWLGAFKCKSQRVDLANWILAQPIFKCFIRTWVIWVPNGASKARQLPISQSLLVPSTRSTSPLRTASPPVQRMVPTLSSRSCPGCRMWSDDFCDRHLQRRWPFRDLLTSNQGFLWCF